MRLIAHAKVNWDLSVLGRRDDGYHELDMLMQSVELGDSLEIRLDEELTLTLHGGPRVPSGDGNLVLRAARRLREAAGVAQGARITMKKRIPVGAGLGGGSADAAAVLLGLNALWNLHMGWQDLRALARSLGSDIPFCMVGGLRRVRGTGEQLEALPCGAPFHLVIVQPCAGLSTPKVFAAYDALAVRPRNPDIEAAVAALAQGDPAALARAMGNALTPASVPIRPQIAMAAQTLEHFGALRAEMTGSGSAVVGLFANAQDADFAWRQCIALWPKSYLTRTTDRGVSLCP